jgi:hypothetical protein
MEVWDPKMIRRNWFVLCWSAKWLDGKKVMHSSLPEFRGYKELPSKTKKNIDKNVMQGLWDLLDECDIAIAHNLKGFDRKKANARFILNGMPPTSHYQLIDTLTVARSQFKFSSNKLGYLSEKLGVEQKMDAGGMSTWLGCEEGDKKTWDKMIKYCDQDVRSLEAVYLKLRPYMPTHPYNNVSSVIGLCSNKGCKGEGTIKDGIRRTKAGIFQKLRCLGCGTSLIATMEKK